MAKIKIVKVASPESVFINPIAPRNAKIAYNFGLSECDRVNLNLKARGGRYGG